MSRRSVGTGLIESLQACVGDSQDVGGSSQDTLQVRPCKLFKNIPRQLLLRGSTSCIPAVVFLEVLGEPPNTLRIVQT